MLERDFGKRNGLRVPRANIGAMRLPENDDDAVALVRHAIDSGMKYIDTSRGYGRSEIQLGMALKDGYREKVILSTKWSPWIMKVEESDDASADCMRRRIEESMSRLDVDYLDYYQVWNINSRESYDSVVAKGGMLGGIRKAIDEGLVRRTGFTTHDTVENLLSYMDEIDWCDIILFTHNMISRGYAPAIAAAHERGIGTIIMNPLAGGMLASSSPFLEGLASEAGVKSVPELAIRWLMTNNGIDTIISGISKLSDVDETIAAVNAGPFDAATFERLESRLREVYDEHAKFCTGCGYCKPCPQNIDIPAVMGAVAQDRYWGFHEAARAAYQNMTTSAADACAKCGECESKCTQKLNIMETMDHAAETLSGK